MVLKQYPYTLKYFLIKNKIKNPLEHNADFWSNYDLRILPEIWMNQEFDSEHRSCDRLNGGFNVNEGDFEGGLFHVSSDLNVVQHQTNVLRVHLPKLVLEHFFTLSSIRLIWCFSGF